MNIGSIDDIELANRVARGDEVALAEIYARYADPLFAYVYHNLDGARSDAEDIWQETWLAGIGAMGTYRGQSKLFTWLCGVARHKIADHYRRQGKNRVESLSSLPVGKLAELMDQGPLPEEVLARHSVRNLVIAVLADLPADYRRVLMARYSDDRGVDEVARLLGKSYKATESLLSRARGAFREALERLDGDVKDGSQRT